MKKKILFNKAQKKIFNLIKSSNMEKKSII